MDDTVRRLFDGDQRALSRLISLVERGGPSGAQIMDQVYPHTGKACCVGITGPPGVGKSTIVDRLAELMRAQGLSVGIIAVDPTSPYSGGTFLGDRIRMQRHYLDKGVFIRSVATRGGPGGLPRLVRGVVRLLDASGKDMVVVETVGVGQTELGIIGVADTVVVMSMPGSGDVIQTLKAGILEIADIYVVNKADMDGADQMVAALTSMLQMAGTSPGMPPGISNEWTPPVLTTQAHKNEGVLELYQAVQRHIDYLRQTSQLESRRQDRRGEEFLATIEEELGRRVKELMEKDLRLRAVLEGVKKGEADPYSAALKLLEDDLPMFAKPPAGGFSSGLRT